MSINKGWLPFNTWSRERIRQGRKHCTSRTKRYNLDPNVTWISPKLPLWFIKKYLWKDEGADSPEELQRVINQIFRKEVSEDKELYVHFGDFKAALQKEE